MYIRQSQYQYWFIDLHFKTDKPFTGSHSFIHLGSHIQNHIPGVRPLWLISIFTNLASGTTDQPLARTNKWPTTTAEDQGSFATSRCYCRCGWTSNSPPPPPTIWQRRTLSLLSLLHLFKYVHPLKILLLNNPAPCIIQISPCWYLLFDLRIDHLPARCSLTQSPFLSFFSAKFVTPIFAT